MSDEDEIDPPAEADEQLLAPEWELEAGAVSESDLSGLSSDQIQKMLVQPSDWTVGVLVDFLERGKINLSPKYQRRIAWNEAKMSRFVESLFLRLPVPQIVLAETSPGRFAVIDGKQRLASIAKFCCEDSEPLSLNGCEYRRDLNGKTWSELKRLDEFEGAVDAFESQTIRTVVVHHWASDDLLYLLFLRLNQNSVTLSPQELRRALFPGDFLNWLDDVTAVSEGMGVLFGHVPDFRMRDMELATRFLAFKLFGYQYSGNMKLFLNETTRHLTRSFEEDKSRLNIEWQRFERSISLSKQIFEGNEFRLFVDNKYLPRVNRAVLDVQSYYFSFDDVIVEEANHFAVRREFERICSEDSKFVRACQSTTKSIDATHYRFHAWRDCLVRVLGDVVAPVPVKAP